MPIEKDRRAAREQLKSPDPALRLKAAYRLAQTGSMDGRSVFLDTIRSPDPDLVLEAAAMLGDIGAHWTVDALSSLLDDEGDDIRNEAIVGLWKSYRVEAVPHLIRALGDDESERREDARVALVEVLGEDVASVLAQMGEEDEQELLRAQDWWHRNESRFDPSVCYEGGRPVSIETWIARLWGAEPGVADVVVRELQMWTGVDLGPAADPDLAGKWEGWWRENGASFPPGHRYFYGHRVDRDDEE